MLIIQHPARKGVTLARRILRFYGLLAALYALRVDLAATGRVKGDLAGGRVARAALCDPLGIDRGIARDDSVKVKGSSAYVVCKPTTKIVSRARGILGFLGLTALNRDILVIHCRAATRVKAHGIGLIKPLGNKAHITCDLGLLVDLDVAAIPAVKDMVLIQRVRQIAQCVTHSIYASLCIHAVSRVQRDCNASLPLGIQPKRSGDKAREVVFLCAGFVQVPALEGIACARWVGRLGHKAAVGKHLLLDSAAIALVKINGIGVYLPSCDKLEIALYRQVKIIKLRSRVPAQEHIARTNRAFMRLFDLVAIINCLERFDFALSSSQLKGDLIVLLGPTRVDVDRLAAFCNFRVEVKRSRAVFVRIPVLEGIALFDRHGCWARNRLSHLYRAGIDSGAIRI